MRTEIISPSDEVNTITEEDLGVLLAEQEDPCVSIYVPVDRYDTQTERNRIRFKNLLKGAEAQLSEYNFPKDASQKLLEPAQRVIENKADDVSWKQRDGLAIFLSGGGFSAFYRLPFNEHHLVYVGPRFRVRPLLPILGGDKRFYILALSQGSVRLFRCSRYRIAEVDLGDIPQSMSEAMRLDAAESQLQFHTGTGDKTPTGSNAAIFHGHDDSVDKEEQITQFFRQLDAGLVKLLKNEDSPLILAGVKYISALYRSVSAYPHILDSGIDGNPEHVTPSDLLKAGWSLIAPHLNQGYEDAVSRYHQLASQDDALSSSDIRHIIASSYYQRVDTLFVLLGMSSWGTLDPETGAVEIHEDRQPGDEDLLDLAVAHTLRNGGQVFAIDATEMPADSPVAAVLRY